MGEKNGCYGARTGKPSPAAPGAPAPERACPRALPALCEAAAIAGVPAVLAACAALRAEHAALLSLAVVLAALGLFFAQYEQRAPRLRDIMPTVVLAACAAAGRVLFGPIPDFKPVSAIAIIAGAVFGRRSGFMTGALAALASNFFLGQGPWTPWQMYAWGLVGYLGGVLAQAGAFRGAERCAGLGGAYADTAPARQPKRGLRWWRGLAQRVLLALPLYLYGFLSGPLYGLILNTWSIVGFYHPQTAAQLAAVYAAALPFDLAHGAATVLFLLALYAPWCRKLARVKRAYGLR